MRFVHYKLRYQLKPPVGAILGVNNLSLQGKGGLSFQVRPASCSFARVADKKKAEYKTFAGQ